MDSQEEDVGHGEASVEKERAEEKVPLCMIASMKAMARRTRHQSFIRRVGRDIRREDWGR